MTVLDTDTSNDRGLVEATARTTSYMDSLTDTIVGRAKEIAGNERRIEPWHVDEAIQEYAPGHPVSEVIADHVRQGVAASAPLDESWLRSITRSINGVTIISALLAVAFGFLALSGVGGAEGGTTASGFLDIAKIFAGAVVGSTATGVAAEARHGTRVKKA
jgi:hypothetical protein